MSNASTLISSRPDRSLTVADRMARNLGWFSLALGIAEIAAPGRLAKALGLEGHEGLIRAFGAREMGAGVWALSDTPAPAMWARVAGDLLDLGTLAMGYRDGDDEQRRNASIAIAAVAGITALDLATALSLRKENTSHRGEARDYGDRSGFPGGAAQARGAAMKDFETPADYRAAPQLAAVSGDLQPA